VPKERQQVLDLGLSWRAGSEVLHWLKSAPHGA